MPHENDSSQSAEYRLGAAVAWRWQFIDRTVTAQFLCRSLAAAAAQKSESLSISGWGRVYAQEFGSSKFQAWIFEDPRWGGEGP